VPGLPGLAKPDFCDWLNVVPRSVALAFASEGKGHTFESCRVRRGQQAPFLPDRIRKAEFTRRWYQWSGVSPAAPPHWTGINRG